MATKPYFHSTPGVLHKFGRNVSAFEHAPAHPAQHTLIFVTGMYGSLCSTAYTMALAQSLPRGWRLLEVELSSARIGFGTGSLAKDISELHALITYLRSADASKCGRVALLGHSTGCQDALLYASTHADVAGIVLQAPVSDRESLLRAEVDEGTVQQAIKTAKEYVGAGRADDVLPKHLTVAFGPVPLSASRWLSLAERGGEDDLFSADLDDEHLAKTFGSVQCGVLVVASGDDEALPGYDWKAQIARWHGAVDKGRGKWLGGEILPGANHDISVGDVAAFTQIVAAFLGRLEQ